MLGGEGEWKAVLAFFPFSGSKRMKKRSKLCLFQECSNYQTSVLGPGKTSGYSCFSFGLFLREGLTE